MFRALMLAGGISKAPKNKKERNRLLCRYSHSEEWLKERLSQKGKKGNNWKRNLGSGNVGAL